MSSPDWLPAKPWVNPDGRLVVSADAARDDWLEARKSMVGASDVATLLGLGKYGDPFTVWASKTGRSVDEPQNDAMRRGQIFETAIVELWAERFAGFPIVTRRQGLLRNREHPIVGATVDRLSCCLMDGTAARCLVEVKSQNDMREWADNEVPLAFQLQGLWQLIATGRDHVHYVAMGPRFIPEHRVIRRDVELEANLIATVEAWWETHVIGDVAPEPSARALTTIAGMFRPDAGERCEIDDDLAQHVHAMLDAQKDLDDATERHDTAKAIIQAAMGSATQLVWPDGEIAATWNATRKVVGNTAKWRKSRPDLVDKYTHTIDVLDAEKMIENEPELLASGEFRFQRTFTKS